MLQDLETEEKSLNSFYEANITLILKLDKDIIEKENLRPVSFNTQKILAKNPAPY